MRSFLVKAKALWMLVAFCGLSTAVLAQQTVTGTVTSATDGSTLPGVTVRVKGTGQGATTNLDGGYRVQVSGPEAVLVFSFVGFEAQEITVGARSVIDISLSEDVTALDEVVVVGYGVETKRELTGAIAKVDGSTITNTVTPSFEAALQGQAPGVQVIQGSGVAGSGSVIRIRGISSVSAGGDPLIVVDGIPITQDNFLTTNWQNGAFNNNPLASINPNDIESVEILKDAAAAGIYGSRGANGVILITTKRGKKGAPTFNFSTRFGISQPVARPEMLNASELLQLLQETWENDGNVGQPDLGSYGINVDWATADSISNATNGVGTDWWDLLTHNGFKQSYDLSMRQGTDLIKSYVGVSYSENGSYIIGNSLERLNARANLDIQPIQSLTIKLSTSFNRGVNNRQRVSYTGGLGDAMSTALPIYPVYEADGSTFWADGANPIRLRENFRGLSIDTRTINNLQVAFRPIEGLEINASGSYDYLDFSNEIWESAELLNNENIGDGQSVTDKRYVNNFNGNAFVQYTLPFMPEGHSLKAMVGGEYQNSVTKGREDLIVQHVSATPFEGGAVDSVVNRYRFIDNIVRQYSSAFARINYNYNQKYFLTLIGRADQSSNFGPSNQTAFMPSASAAWVLSEEGFLAGNPVLNFLKLRASYGILGNSDFAALQWLGRYRFADINNGNVGYNGQSLLEPQIIPNEDLRWETSANLDLGLELGLFDDRITAEAAYYRRVTRDVLMQVQLPQYSGFGSQFDNVGRVLNQGVDLTVTSRNLVGEFKWTTVFNLGRNYNEVLDIGGFSPDAVSGGTNDTRIIPGFPVGTNYLVPFSHVDPATGRPVYIDINGNPTFEYNEQRDRRAVGKVLPDATGGFTNTFNYKGFDLSALFVFTIGGNIYDSSLKRQTSVVTDWNLRRDVFDRWREPGDEAQYPKLSNDFAEFGNDKEWLNTDQWLFDASYVRLRNLSVGYNLPTSILDPIKIKSARLALSGTNLLTFTRYPGIDPEIARDFDSPTDRNMSQNITFLTPPQEKSYNVSLSINF